MKVTRILLAALIPTLIFISCGSGNQPDKKPAIADKSAVIQTDSASVRIHPILHSAKLYELKKGEIVTIKDVSAMQASIGNSRDYWYHIENSQGASGWIYGQNIAIVSSKDSGKMKDLVKVIQEEELELLKKELAGKWWSIDRSGNFTNHGMDIYPDGKYESYTRGSSAKIEGEYNFDVNKNEIVFLQSTTFKDDLNYLKRGQGYTLFRGNETAEIRFQKIQSTPGSQSEEPNQSEQQQGKP